MRKDLESLKELTSHDSREYVTFRREFWNEMIQSLDDARVFVRYHTQMHKGTALCRKAHRWLEKFEDEMEQPGT